MVAITSYSESVSDVTGKKGFDGEGGSVQSEMSEGKGESVVVLVYHMFATIVMSCLQHEVSTEDPQIRSFSSSLKVTVGCVERAQETLS